MVVKDFGAGVELDGKQVMLYALPRLAPRLTSRKALGGVISL